MSLSSIATNIYTIQSKKKVPLKTAFSMMVREDLAMRFSVYNLVKTVTKSDLLATVAQTAYGKRTPMQQKQDREELQKEKRDKKFKQFTVGSIATLNKRLNLLQTVTEQNSAMITAIYKDIGYFKGQRKIEPFTTRATRIPIASKSIKGKIDEINDQLRKLSKLGKKPFVPKKKKVPEKKEKKEDEKSFIESFIPFLLRNPRLAMLATGGTGAALSLGSFMLQGYSLFNIQKSGSRILDRFQGKPGFEDELTETISRGVDTGVATIGAGTVAGVATAGAAYLRRKRIAKATKTDAATARIKSIQTQTERLKKVGVSHKRAQKIAGASNRVFNRMAKWKFVNSAFKGIAKKLPGAFAADVAFELARMSGYVADRDMNKMTQEDFKKKMVGSYAELISTVGIGGLSTVAGTLAGTALFPGLGSVGGGILGAGLGGLASILTDEEDLSGIAQKVFGLLHEDKSLLSLFASQQTTVKPVAGATNTQMVQGPPTSLSSLIERGESKAFGGYTAYNQKLSDGTYKPGKADFSQLTIDQILQGQQNKQFHAVGKYQMIRSTLSDAKKYLKLSGNEKFTPEMQEHIFVNYLIGAKRPQIRDYLSGNSNNLDAALLALSQEWSSISTKYDSMSSYYSKDKASISKQEAANALISERNRRVAMAVGEVRPTATIVAAIPPPTPAPASAAMPPPVVASTIKKDSTVSEKTEIRSVASLGAIELMNKNINNRLSNIEQRIIGIEKLRPQEFPFIEDPNFFS